MVLMVRNMRKGHEGDVNAKKAMEDRRVKKFWPAFLELKVHPKQRQCNGEGIIHEGVCFFV
jgi:hypothetical protein